MPKPSTSRGPQLFKDTMLSIGQPVITSDIATTLERSIESRNPSATP
jgi:hypothetical protein